MHDGLQEPFHGPAVEPLAVQRYGFHLTGGGLCVDRISQLDFAARSRRLVTQDLEDVWRQDITADRGKIRRRLLEGGFFHEARDTASGRAGLHHTVFRDVGSITSAGPGLHRIRHFRLDRIHAIQVEAQSFIRDPEFNLEAHAARAFGSFQSDDEYSEVIWRFSPAARR